MVGPAFQYASTRRQLEGELQSVLNFPVADVARGIRYAKVFVGKGARSRSANRSRIAAVNTVLDEPAVYLVVHIRIPEHRMIEQVEELHTELKGCFLAEELQPVRRNLPVLNDGEVHILNSRS